MTRLTNYFLLLRPQQWIKNLFVFVGLVFSGAIVQPALFVDGLMLFFGFSLGAGSVYVLNDLIDAEQDRLHEQKRFRPIASRAVTEKEAYILTAFSTILSSLLIGLVSLTALAILISYLLMNLAYTLSLKNIPILDVFVVAFGFVLRVFIGTFGLGIAPSNWLILCTLSLTLFLGFSKRKAEKFRFEDNAQTRQVLEKYTTTFLDHALTVTASATILSYALYTMSEDTINRHGTENLLYSALPVTFAIFRYFYLIESRLAGEDAATSLVKDKALQLSVLAWLGLFFGLQLLTY